MSASLKGSKQRLVVAAIECIEAEGLDGVTVRSIATRASANVASVAYHFGSKDELLEIALERAWENAAGDLREFLVSEPWDPRGGIERMILFLVDGALVYPRLTAAILFSERPACRKAAAEMASLFSRAAERSARAMGRSDGGLKAERVAAFLAASIFPTIAGAFFSSAFTLDLRDAAVRGRYISGLVGDFVGRIAS